MNLFDRIRDLKEKAARATRGPWSVSGSDIIALYARTFFDGTIKMVVGNPDYLNEEDESYIATASPELISELCTALEEARELAEFVDNAKPEGRDSIIPQRALGFCADKARAFLEKWGRNESTDR